MKRIIIAVCLLLSLVSADSTTAQKANTNHKQGDRIRAMATENNGVIQFKDFIKYDNSKASKKETEDWIVQKLNKYATKEISVGDAHSAGYPIVSPPGSQYFSQSEKVAAMSAKIGNDALFIDIWKTVTITTDAGTSTKYEKEHVSILLENLQSIYFSDAYGRELEFWSFDETINNNGRLTNSYSLHFENGKEDDIKMRLIKAFVHLESFYWKKLGHETF